MAYPELPKFPVFPGEKQGLPEDTAPQDVPPPPAAWSGSGAEWRAYYWLTKHKVDFLYQAPQMGGRQFLGGLIADFVICDRQPWLVINVQGEHWHFGSSQLAAQDLITKAQLMNMGYDVVYVRESDLEQRLDYTMKRALDGVQLYRD